MNHAAEKYRMLPTEYSLTTRFDIKNWWGKVKSEIIIINGLAPKWDPQTHLFGQYKIIIIYFQIQISTYT